MSALRTLRRRLNDADMIRGEDGELVKHQRAKPGSFNRRILAEATVDGRCYRYHATKGVRIHRAA